MMKSPGVRKVSISADELKSKYIREDWDRKLSKLEKQTTESASSTTDNWRTSFKRKKTHFIDNKGQVRAKTVTYRQADSSERLLVLLLIDDDGTEYVYSGVPETV